MRNAHISEMRSKEEISTETTTEDLKHLKALGKGKKKDFGKK
jgi:hypothetical protein